MPQSLTEYAMQSYIYRNLVDRLLAVLAGINVRDAQRALRNAAQAIDDTADPPSHPIRLQGTG